MAGLTHAFLVGMGIHPESYRLIVMTQFLGYTSHSIAICNGDACECMTEFMGMQAGDCGCMGSGRFCCVRTYLLIACAACSRLSLLSRWIISGSTSIVRTLPLLGGIKIDALLGRIAKVSGDGDRVGLEVNILPPEAAAFATSDAGVNEETHQGLPLERLLLQSLKNALDVISGVRLQILVLKFAFSGLGTLYLVHWIGCNDIRHIRHFEQAVQDRVDLDAGGVGRALGLHG